MLTNNIPNRTNPDPLEQYCATQHGSSKNSDDCGSDNNGVILHYCRRTQPHHHLLPSIKDALTNLGLQSDATNLLHISTEDCFNVQITSKISSNVGGLSGEDKLRLEWLLAETFDTEGLLLEQSTFDDSSNCKMRVWKGIDNEDIIDDITTDGNTDDHGSDHPPCQNSNNHSLILEFGPRMTFTSAFSSNATSICSACGLSQISRMEKSNRYMFTTCSKKLGDKAIATIKLMLHDRMTEEEYKTPLRTFDSGFVSKPVTTVPIITEGRAALERINLERGLGFDDFDLDYYTDLFRTKLGRDPTDVECFDMGQSNSEHSRHWFFGGKMIIDGIEKSQTLFQMVKSTLPSNDKDSNSIIAFHDNSSCIRGYECDVLKPTSFDRAGPMVMHRQTLHPILTAETHNFPCGVAPFPGAETGTGGRLRDVMATGRGAYPIAGISSYCVGNLNIPGYILPWEDKSFLYPTNLASPIEIELEASSGASDYGNKYGEPVIHGFTRSFGQRLPNGERFEWVKPIMFSAGVGQIDDNHTVKGEAEKGMLVVKVGGPAYRIGIGGGAASSRVQSSESADLDFDAVQRGDAEMENRLNRLMRACCDLNERNPIISVHDQGAGGNGNVLKEIVEPAGASYDVRKIYVGDNTLSVLEIWGAEYQENNALLIRPESEELLKQIAKRENCPIRVLGSVTGDGRVVVHDSLNETSPVDLPLEMVLGKMPQKTFLDKHGESTLLPLVLPTGATLSDALDRVLRLISVGSKRFLVNKVDRSVTGLIAQQQCVGPLQLPLSNVGVTARTHFGITGTAVACGEQPIKGLVNAAAMARMSVTEAMTNLVWAKISSIKDIKASANWMYAAKLPGEGAKMYDACEALRDSFLALGCGIDGGKDSLSMAAKCGDEVVKAPGELTITCYVTCPDITKTITPDIKCHNGSSILLFVDLGNGNFRLGGSALAQVYGQVGNECPDMENFEHLKLAFEATQDLIESRLILSGHDRSDGGLIVALLEMAFAGNCSIDINIPTNGASEMAILFCEEAGLVLEVDCDNATEVKRKYKEANVSCFELGTASSGGNMVRISLDGKRSLESEMTALRDVWEATSFQLERKQRNPQCVMQEEEGLKKRKAPDWNLSYTPCATPPSIMAEEKKHKVAVIRQEGSNGDREMLSAFHSAGFEAWDITVNDLVGGLVPFESFRGIVFVGGFSYADVLGSGKGWAGVIMFNERVLQQFNSFRKRTDTFSLGVCNGCQLMTLLGWLPRSNGLPENQQPRLLENDSFLFESRFVSVKIVKSPAVLLKGMENSSLGVWVSHGEGRFHFPSESVLNEVMNNDLAPIRYVNDSNDISDEYPFNPNGSPSGMAALCSEDGRHLAMMPHPERCFTSWQWPWKPKGWEDYEVGPWLQLFQNAREFCDSCSPLPDDPLYI